MVISNIKSSFNKEVETVWNLVTSLEHYGWRSDLEKIQVVEENKKFIEYTKEGYATQFTITAFEPYKSYEFDMENSNMKGHWAGIFNYENGVTTIDFTEKIEAKKLIMKPFVKGYLKKQQAAYIADLRKALE